jgi:hypothetical protein
MWEWSRSIDEHARGALVSIREALNLLVQNTDPPKDALSWADKAQRSSLLAVADLGEIRSVTKRMRDMIEEIFDPAPPSLE